MSSRSAGDTTGGLVLSIASAAARLKPRSAAAASRCAPTAALGSGDGGISDDPTLVSSYKTLAARREASCPSEEKLHTCAALEQGVALLPGSVSPDTNSLPAISWGAVPLVWRRPGYVSLGYVSLGGHCTQIP